MTGEAPKALLDRPELDFRQAYYFSAYQALASSRNTSMSGPLSIPVSEILSYCELFYIKSLNERERLFRYVKSLDNAYLDWAAAQSKKNSPK